MDSLRDVASMKNQVLQTARNPNIERSNLVKILSKPPLERVYNDLLFIKEYLIQIKLLDPSIHKQENLFLVLRNLRIICLEPEEILYKESQPSDGAYIIVQGQVHIIEMPYNKNPQDITVIKKIGPGHLFGEEDIEEEASLRYNSCLASERSFLVHISKDEWILLKGSFESSTLSSRNIQVLRLLPFFAGKTDEAILEIIKAGHIHRYSSETIIFRPEELLESLFIIIGGRVRVIKEIKAILEPAERFLNIDFLGVGDVIGDICYILKSSVGVSIVSFLPVKLLEIPFGVLKHVLSDAELDLMITSLRLLPPDNEIANLYREKVKWTQYVEDMKTDLMNEKHLISFVTNRNLGRYMIPPVYKLKAKTSFLKAVGSEEINSYLHKKSDSLKGTFLVQKRFGKRELIHDYEQCKHKQSEEFKKQYKKIEEEANKAVIETNVDLYKSSLREFQEISEPEEINNVIKRSKQVVAFVNK